MVAIVDYDMGNVGSIKNMLRKIGVAAEITRDKNILYRANKLIIPGVGAFDAGMQQLEKLELLPILNELVQHKNVPVLGICLGMQLLTSFSEEGNVKGLNWIEGVTCKFQQGTLRIPHMGWNSVMVHKSNDLFKGLENDNRFYFVHSYFVKPVNSQHEAASTKYIVSFSSSIHNNNVYGVQFHPEKSHRFGLTLFENFAAI